MTPTDTAADAAITAACTELHLPTIRAEAGHLADQATKANASHRAYLAEVLCAEVDDRAERRRQRRVHEARFARHKRLEDFDTTCSPVAPAVIAALAEGAFIEAGEPVCFVGDSGTGKSHLLIGTGMAACEAGRRVRYATAAALVNELVEAADDKVLSRVVARYGRLDLLCLDELGYLSLDTKGASSCSRCSPNARNGRRWPSPPTPPSVSSARCSAIPAWPGRWSTGSPSVRSSSRPAPSRSGCARRSHGDVVVGPPARHVPITYSERYNYGCS